jgi:LuxR family transcriptional regulator, maltose regulon positive regulatory protein
MGAEDGPVPGGRGDGREPGPLAPWPPRLRLPRRALVERLLRVPQRGLGLIVAPPGYGGSTLLDLVAEAAPQIPVRVDLSDGGPGFWATLQEALAAAGIAGDTPGDPAEHPQAALLAALRAAPEVLVLVDDVTAHAGDPAEAELAAFLARAPETVRVVARARRAPSMDVSRLLAGGRLVLLDRGDLTLTVAEVDTLLGGIAPWLAPDRHEALRRLCEGWAGALCAGVLGTGGSAEHDPAGWLLGPGLELLVGGGVAGLDPLDRAMLVRSSVLARLTAEACDALTGRSDSGQRLGRLAAELVVSPLPGGRGVGYGVHPLLREHLRRLLEVEPGAEQAAHRVAGAWFAARGMADEAITHHLAAGDLPAAATVLAEHVESLLDAGAAPQVSDWYRSAPQLALATSDLHLLAAAWADLLSGRRASAQAHHVTLQRRADELVADRARPHEAVAPSHGGGRWLQTESTFLGATIDALAGRTGSALRGLQASRAAYGEDWSRAAHQSAAMLEVRLHLWLERPDAAERVLTAVGSRPGTVASFRRVQIPAAWARIAVMDGRVHRGRQLAREALEAHAELGSIAPFDTCEAQLALAGALHELDRLAEAQAEAEEVVSQARQGGHVPLEVLGLTMLARIRASMADPSAAQASLEHARTRLREEDASRELGRVVERAGVLVAVAGGDRRVAAQLLDRLEPAPGGTERDPGLLMTVAAMGGARSESDVVRLVRAHRPVTPREVVTARILMAGALAGTRRAEAAMHLRTACDLALEQGMLRALCHRHEALLVLAAEVGAEPAGGSVRSLVDRTAVAPEPPPPIPALSPGERDLLQRLADAPANRELAAELGISVNTLKTRLRRLYAKLGVHDRAGALRAVARSQ